MGVGVGLGLYWGISMIFKYLYFLLVLLGKSMEIGTNEKGQG